MDILKAVKVLNNTPGVYEAISTSGGIEIWLENQHGRECDFLISSTDESAAIQINKIIDSLTA